MGYQSLIDRNLSKAFTLVKDLALDAVFTKKSNLEFSFSTAEMNTPKNENINAKIIVTETKKPANDRNTFEKIIMVKSKDVGDLNWYSTVKFENKTWNISSIQKNDGFVLMANVFRENI
jgi:hypothetical protein